MNKFYHTNPLLKISPSRNGQFEAIVSVSSQPVIVDVVSYEILAEFLQPKKIENVISILRKQYTSEVITLIQERIIQLIKKNFIVPVSTKATLSTTGFASELQHYFMINDSTRVIQYQRAIEKYAKNQNILEIGTGSGILSIFAAKSGAKKVVAIEETSIANLAQKMVTVNNLNSKIQIVHGNSQLIAIKEKFDIIIHELFDSDPFEENLIPILLHAKKNFLVPQGRFLPNYLDVHCFGCQIGEVDDLQYDLKQREMLYNLNLSPLINALNKQRGNPAVLNFTRIQPTHLNHLTGKVDLYKIDFSHLNQTIYKPKNFTYHVEKPGVLNAIAVYFTVKFDADINISTLPWAPPTHWKPSIKYLAKPVEVKSGQQLRMEVSIINNGLKQSIDIKLK